MSRIVGDSPRSHCKSAFKLNLWNAARTNSTLGRSRGPGSELASKVAAKVGNGSHAFPNKSSPLLAWSRYPSAGMSHLHELLGRPIIFHRYTPKKTETRGISVALLPPPRHTICITDISRARDLYVLRTTSSSNLKLTDLPAGHKLTHECDDNYSSWYIYTSVCVYICAYAGCDNGESLLSWQEELREGRGNECLERLHAPRSITPKCCFVPCNKHLAILFVMEEGFFFFFILDLKNREMEILERGGEDFYFYGI